MASSSLFIDLVPLPPKDATTLRLGLNVHGAFTSAQDAQQRIDVLRARLDAIPGEFPSQPEDDAGAKPWNKIEEACASQLGEFLPWSWAGVSLKLFADGNFLVDEPTVLRPSTPTLHADSVNAVRRGFLKALRAGSSNFTASSAFHKEVIDPSGTRFSFRAYTAQSLGWPAPVPQEALCSVMILEVPWAAFEKLPAGAQVFAVLAFEVAGRTYKLPMPADIKFLDDPDTEGQEGADTKVAKLKSGNWLSTDGSDAIAVESACLVVAELLNPTESEESFLHPAKTLWLRDQLKNAAPFERDEHGPGQAIGDHDWWSRLHDGVATAADLPRLVIDSLRDDARATEVDQGFESLFLGFCGMLRDRLEPGIAPDRAAPQPVGMYRFLRAPVMLDILVALRAADLAESTPFDLLALVVNAGKNGWDVLNHPPASMSPKDLGRLCLVYCVLHRERSSELTLDGWYAQLAALAAELRLPKRAELLDFLGMRSAQERIALMESLRVECMRPAVRAAALYESWKAASVLASDPPLLAHAKAQAQAFLGSFNADVLAKLFTQQDVGPLFSATASLDAVSLASRAAPAGSPKPRFATRIADAVVRHAEVRMDKDSVFLPRLAMDPSRLKGLRTAAEAVGEEAHRWIFRRGAVDDTGEPGPLVLEIDTLHDDSEWQNQQTDLNVWLNGYCAFFRRVGVGKSGWGSGQIGRIEASAWDPPRVLNDPTGTPIAALFAQPASSSYGVRHILLQHNNRTQLPASGVDVIDNSGSRQVGNGWQGAETCRVVAGVGKPAALLPFLAFGIEYEAAVFAQSRAGVIPEALAGKFAAEAPYNLDLSVDLDEVFAKVPVRKLPYLRRAKISAPRVKQQPVVKDPHWSPLSVSRSIELAGTAFPARAGEDVNAVCVLMSEAGLPPGEKVSAGWKELAFELRPPTCTHPVYDRWIAHEEAKADAAEKPKWRAWRERIHASEMLVSALKGQSLDDPAVQQLVNDTLADERAQLDDPAVKAYVVRWHPVRGDGTAVPPHVLVLQREAAPPVPKKEDPNDDTVVLFERGRCGPSDWTLTVRVHDVKPPPKTRFKVDEETRVLTFLVLPGEIGDLEVVSAAHKDDLMRCDLSPLGQVDDFRTFEAWRARIEVATPDRLPAEGVYKACRVEVAASRDIRLYWSRDNVQPHAGNAPEMLQFDNVGALRARRQVWHSTGRPLPTFPAPPLDLDTMDPLAKSQDGSPDPTTSGVLWDAIGFAERMETSASWSKKVTLTVGNARQVFLDEPAGADASPRYVRYTIEASHRYAALYLPMMRTEDGRNHFEPYVAEQSFAIPGGTQPATDHWKRAFRPGANVPHVPRPAVRLVVPLTRSLERDAGTGADLLVVLNEEVDTISPLLTRLEAGIEVVTRKWEDGTAESRLEFGPDPILSCKAQSGTFVGLSCVGPLGHTFDTDSREPYFVGMSYVVKASPVMQAWDMAKLSFRRLLLPELMDGYFAEPADSSLPRPVTTPTLGPLEISGEPLEAAGQGHLSMMNVARGGSGTTLTIEFLGQSLVLKLSRRETPEGDVTRHVWSLAASGALPAAAFLDTDWKPEILASTPLTDTALLSADFRLVAARVREARPDEKPPIPALWELAGYVAVSTRPAPIVEGQEFAAGWDRIWQRILTWRADEPTDAAALQVQLRSSELARHGVGQTVARMSDYTPAEWVQTLPDASSLSINGKPWVEKKPGGALSVRVFDAAQRVLGVFDGETPAVLNWQDQPVAHGSEGQGLHYRLLVTRAVQAADGSTSEAYYGIFNRKGGDRFEPIELHAEGAALPPAEDLRAYVMLVQSSPRAYTKAMGFWDALFPPQGDSSASSNPDDPRQTQDARQRILAVGDPVFGQKSNPSWFGRAS